MPNDDFTKQTMEKIKLAETPKTSFSWKKVMWPLASIALVAVLIISGVIVYQNTKTQKSEVATTPKVTTSDEVAVNNTTSTAKSQEATEISAQLSQVDKEVSSGDNLDFSSYNMADISNN